MGTHPIFESDFDCLTDYVGIELIPFVCNIRYQSSRVGVENTFGSSCKWGWPAARNHCSRVRCYSYFYKLVSSYDSWKSSMCDWSSPRLIRIHVSEFQVYESDGNNSSSSQ